MCVGPSLVSAHISAPTGLISLHATHIPPGCTNGWTKVYMLEAATAIASKTSDTPRILCGDFNVPQAEMPLGRIVTWLDDSRPTVSHDYVCERGGGTHAAEMPRSEPSWRAGCNEA
jgi:hypothetical protein